MRVTLGVFSSASPPGRTKEKAADSRKEERRTSGRPVQRSHTGRPLFVWSVDPMQRLQLSRDLHKPGAHQSTASPSAGGGADEEGRPALGGAPFLGASSRALGLTLALTLLPRPAAAHSARSRRSCMLHCVRPVLRHGTGRLPAPSVLRVQRCARASAARAAQRKRGRRCLVSIRTVSAFLS